MKLRYSKHFLRTLRKLPGEDQRLVIEALAMLVANPHHSSLRHHLLRGKHQGEHSITVRRDLRVIFLVHDGSVAHLLAVGTHDTVY